ncbi:MAG: hypothetical protein JWN70_4629 [Planctomycetaceae bacterium]|nr:hypothetical protein [Planctomycetaceae bacterium]
MLTPVEEPGSKEHVAEFYLETKRIWGERYERRNGVSRAAPDANMLEIARLLTLRLLFAVSIDGNFAASYLSRITAYRVSTYTIYIAHLTGDGYRGQSTSQQAV